MDRETARQASKILGVLIGEIMEDHADLALAGDSSDLEWADQLAAAGHDIAALAAAAGVIARRICQATDEF